MKKVNSRSLMWHGHLDVSALALLLLAALIVFTVKGILLFLPISARTGALGAITFAIAGAILGALTTINDRRNVAGRAAVGEPPSLAPIELLAIGGIGGTIFNWVAWAIVAASLLGSTSGEAVTSSQLIHALITAFTAPAVVGTYTIQLAWISCATLSVGSTWCSLQLGRAPIIYQSLSEPLSLVIIVMAAWGFFDEEQGGLAGAANILVLALSIIATAVVAWADRSSLSRAMSVERCLPWWAPPALLLGRVILLAASGLLIRGLAPGAEDRTLVVASFRPLYFSGYLIFGAIYLAGRFAALRTWRRNVADSQPRRSPETLLRGLQLTVVTILLFSFGDLLSDVAKGSALAATQILMAAIKLLLVPVAGALYGVAGGLGNVGDRCRTVFRDLGPAAVLTLALLMGTMLGWILLSV